MDIAAKFQDQTVFHMTGKRSGDGLVALDGGYRPALLANYRDLTRLRYDFPVVLLDADADRNYAESLSSVISMLIDKLAPRGVEGERLRRQLLRVERELRTLVAGGATGSLSELWPEAVARAAGNADEASDVLLEAGESLGVTGALVDCDRMLATRFITRAWGNAHAEKARAFRAQVDHLVRTLSDIVRAAFVHSLAGQQPQSLKSAFGSMHAESFDFAAMSRLVARNLPIDELHAPRRQRIEWALGVLNGQAFYPDPKRAGEVAPYEFEFDNCAAAMAAHAVRLPKLVEVVKALAVAQLDAIGAYVDAKHDPFFERFDELSLTAEDLAQFPDYLVCIPDDRNDAAENAMLVDMLSAGMPVKVLVQHTDLLEDAAVGQGHFAFGVRSTRLATTAMGLGGMFVLQTTSSNLVALRERVRRGMECRGPSLFSVFAGSPAEFTALPAYMTAAAAMEARAFPAFTYDATSGSNWAARFSLENNRNQDEDWPLETFEYADDDLQRVREPVRFTYADFVLGDRRHWHHFAIVPRERWTMAMLPLADWLTLAEREAAERVPFVLAVDDENRLHRVIVDMRLVQATRRCVLLWHRLQEHGGIHNSHAEQALARERAAQDATRQDELDTATGPAQGRTDQAAPTIAPEPEPSSEVKPPSDEAWIETARCSSCNECQNINDKLFGYNENKQAYIKDINAGTYKDIIEAAEACQVAIIHPGKPKNPNEPGIAELLERARPFM